ncbi:hypothetical protein CANARDRAFT_25729 [[Candida] arabinofermentans NRRL YB-2248]|uniref:C2H2-type domain-containing protein n=1 Tax=[Candida] arabinofermentans NRRL YB-2248 TaxID=983967 RepID=A0A1E4STD6_9ASCO|nr:hypothetical protein CANARDRAFT_25729 [[Candida] arabinofermentans NRRL YB-2248]
MDDSLLFSNAKDHLKHDKTALGLEVETSQEPREKIKSVSTTSNDEVEYNQDELMQHKLDQSNFSFPTLFKRDLEPRITGVLDLHNEYHGTSESKWLIDSVRDLFPQTHSISIDAPSLPNFNCQLAVESVVMVTHQSDRSITNTTETTSEQDALLMSDVIRGNNFLSVDSTEITTKPSRRSIFRCNLCNKTYNKRVNLARHKVIHSDKLKCKWCNKRYDRRSRLQQHYQNNSACSIKQSSFKRSAGTSSIVPVRSQSPSG